MNLAAWFWSSALKATLQMEIKYSVSICPAAVLDLTVGLSLTTGFCLAPVLVLLM